MKKIFLFLIVFLFTVSISNIQAQTAGGYNPPCKTAIGGVEIDGKCFDCGNADDSICPDIVLGIENYCSNKGHSDPDCIIPGVCTTQLIDSQPIGCTGNNYCDGRGNCVSMYWKYSYSGSGCKTSASVLNKCMPSKIGVNGYDTERSGNPTVQLATWDNSAGNKWCDAYECAIGTPIISNCQGTEPSGTGVLKGSSNYPEGYRTTSWAYDPEGMITFLNPRLGPCSWYCSSGYTQSGNTCVSIPAVCTLTSVSISPNCDTDDCQAGETISMSATFTGDCSSANNLQIDVSDGSCNIEYTAPMSGINSDVTITSSDTTKTARWTIPSVTSDCVGKQVTATAAALWQGKPRTGIQKASTTSVTGSFAFATTILSDTTPPVITLGPIVFGDKIKTDSADINWETNEPANSTVEYGTSTSYGSEVSATEFVTNRTITLTGLSPVTTYHFRACSTDPSNNKRCSDDNTFTTATTRIDITPPLIRGIYNISSQTTATITWETNELANSTVKYETTTGTYNLIESDINFVYDHEIGLTDLTQNTNYYYKVCSTDSSNNEACSLEQTFKTLLAVCNLNSVSISPNCGADGCQAGETITVNAEYTSACPSTAIIQVDAKSSDSSCTIAHSTGNMVGIDVTCTSSPCTRTWTIPTIPSQCQNKKIDAFATNLYYPEIAPTNIKNTITITPTGSFDLGIPPTITCTKGTDCTGNKICIEGQCETNCIGKTNEAKCSDGAELYTSTTDGGVCISGPLCYHGEVYQNAQLGGEYFESCATTNEIFGCDSDVLDPLGYRKEGLCCNNLCMLDGLGREGDTCCGTTTCATGLYCDKQINGICKLTPITCIASWSCDPWSVCSATGTQTRTCTDSNDCRTTANKPSESQTCSIGCCLLDNVCKDQGTINGAQACIKGTWQSYAPGECGKLTCNDNGCAITIDNTKCKSTDPKYSDYDYICENKGTIQNPNFVCTNLCLDNRVNACCFCYSTCKTKVGIPGRAPETIADCDAIAKNQLFELEDCR